METENQVGQRFKAYFKNGNGYNKKESIIDINLVKFTPKFEIIKHHITYFALFGEVGKKLKEACDNLGLMLNAQKFYLEVKNYNKLLSNIFQDYKCEDCQSIGFGHPDFKFIHKNNLDITFYIEVKKNGDGIRASQLNWIINNPKEEVWFLFIKDSKY